MSHWDRSEASDEDLVRRSYAGAELLEREKLQRQAQLAEAQAAFEEGQELFNKRMYDKALVAFERAVSINPDHAGAMDLLRRTRQLARQPGDGFIV